LDNLLNVAFEAHNFEKNHHRRYQITLGRDLLDEWTVSINFGRTGQAGREMRYAASDAKGIQAIIRKCLRRRLSAPKRIGCPYRLASLTAAPGIQASEWLPEEVMAEMEPFS
jgi:hypothetical protein